MDGLAGYGGSSSDEEGASSSAIQNWSMKAAPTVNLAPNVDVTAVTEFRAFVDPFKKTVMTNPTVEALSEPGARPTPAPSPLLTALQLALI